MSTGERALFRLMSWLSPSFPVGSYTYSHGLEPIGYDRDETASAEPSGNGSWTDLVMRRARDEYGLLKGALKAEF